MKEFHCGSLVPGCGLAYTPRGGSRGHAPRRRASAADTWRDGNAGNDGRSHQVPHRKGARRGLALERFRGALKQRATVERKARVDPRILKAFQHAADAGSGLRPEFQKVGSLDGKRGRLPVLGIFQQTRKAAGFEQRIVALDGPRACGRQRKPQMIQDRRATPRYSFSARSRSVCLRSILRGAAPMPRAALCQHSTVSDESVHGLPIARAVFRRDDHDQPEEWIEPAIRDRVSASSAVRCCSVPHFSLSRQDTCQNAGLTPPQEGARSRAQKEAASVQFPRTLGRYTWSRTCNGRLPFEALGVRAPRTVPGGGSGRSARIRRSHPRRCGPTRSPVNAGCGFSRFGQSADGGRTASPSASARAR